MSKNNEYLKISFIGASQVGKTKLIERFVQHVFIEGYDPACPDSYRKMISLDNKTAVLEILDQDSLAVQELPNQFLREANGVIIAFSLTSMKSFEGEVEALYEQVLKIKQADAFPMVLVGLKSDLEEQREVSDAQAMAFASKLGIPYIAASAKHGTNTDDCFFTLVRLIREREAVDKPVSPTKPNKKECQVM